MDHRAQLEKKVALGIRNFGIGSVLFRHVVGDHLGINVTDMECLGILFFKGIATPSELSKYTGLSSGATTAMLDRLEKSGLVVRKPNPQDRRGRHIMVVKEAAKEFDPLFASARAAQDALLASYADAELSLLADFFERFAAVWEEEREKLIKLSASLVQPRPIGRMKRGKKRGG